MYGIALQPIHLQACEAFEVTIESTQGRRVLDGDGGKMRVADHVPATANTDQEPTEQGRVAIRRSDDARSWMCQPFVDHAQCGFE